MTTHEKSIALWLGGAVVGAVAGTLTPTGDKHPTRGAFLGALLGAVVVGSIGDVHLERGVRWGR